MKKTSKKWWLFLAVLMMALTISPAASVFAGGSSGGSGSGYVSSERVDNWELPPITKRILLPDNKTKFTGEVKFDIKVTLLGYGPHSLHPLALKTERNEFTISFSGNEVPGGNSVEKSYEINTLVHQMVSEMEKQLPPSGGGAGGAGGDFHSGGGGAGGNFSSGGRVMPSKPYDRILVEISESESSTPGLSLVLPEKNLVTITVDLTHGGARPYPLEPMHPKVPEPNGPVPIRAPKISMPDSDLYLKGPEPNVYFDNTRFTNQYNPDTPDCPNPDQGNCTSGCKSGCPDINININNQNNSSANNNNVNNNTNVGRDQYNVNQAANPNLKLNRYNHFAYVHGYPDHSFRPEGSITRGEMTAIFRRLLDQGIFSGGNGTQFRDVRAGDWYASDVARLSSLGVIAGYPDGTFRPNASVTRAEFANVASKFVSAKSGQSFSDLNGHWAQGAIEKLKSAGWVTGYGDGSFRPDSVITRAEVVSITNRMLERAADANYVRNNRGSLIQYTDLPSGHWAYLPIMEASNAHDYTRNADGSETWTRNRK